MLEGALEGGELPDFGGSRVSDADMVPGDLRFVRLGCLIPDFTRSSGFVECSFARCCWGKVM